MILFSFKNVRNYFMTSGRIISLLTLNSLVNYVQISLTILIAGFVCSSKLRSYQGSKSVRFWSTEKYDPTRSRITFRSIRKNYNVPDPVRQHNRYVSFMSLISFFLLYCRQRPKSLSYKNQKFFKSKK